MKPASGPASAPEIDDYAPISGTVQALRQRAGLTLSELSKASGISASALSKIENGQMSPTYDTMIRLAKGLDVDMPELFGASPKEQINGRRVITRRGAGLVQRTPHYSYEMLCADITNKAFVPLLTTIHARSREDFGTLTRHEGEEFFYVMSGALLLYTEHYAPTRLEAGDCAYFDSRMGHALVSVSDEPAMVLWIATRVFGPLASDPLALP
jgi:transcriptional regulator with XRE-family HTH domain